MPRRQYQYDDAFRAKIVAEFRTPGPEFTAKALAARYNLRTSQIYSWAKTALGREDKARRLAAAAKLGVDKAASLRHTQQEGENVQVTAFRVRGLAGATEILEALRKAGLAPQINSPGNGWHFVTVWERGTWQHIAMWVNKWACPFVTFDVRGKGQDEYVNVPAQSA